MDVINWSEYNGDSFQTFCNVLLSFEISKQYVPFDAPGADGGVDGWYDGEYGGKKGKWRFQAKFHAPETGRMSGVNQLKQQIKKDLEKNITNEDYVVFITNVEVNPNQRKELLEITKKALTNINSKIIFDLWDGAKIKTILARFPLVKLWYFDDFKYIIQGYKEFFHEQLDVNQNSFYTLSNKFYHREDNIKKLNEFVNHDSKTTAIISGDAGIGKTRLCIEFFKKHIDSSENWRGLVLVTHKLDFEAIRKALTGNTNYIVLLDDAHNFEAKDVADLIEIVNSIKENKVKLLLTVRSYFSNEVLGKLRPALKTKILSVKPKNLTREETTSFLEQELKGYIISEHINYLVNMTHGKPIMIVTLLKMIRDGLPFKSISKSSNLNDFISGHFQSFCQTLSKETDLEKTVIYNVIKIISLIEPIPLNDSQTLELMSSNEDVSTENLELILNSLLKEKLIVGSRNHSIKPDYYSDFILKNAIENKSWFNKKLPLYSSHLNNIIKNLGSIESDNVESLLNPLLENFIKQIDTCDNTHRLGDILETIYFITFPKPSIASKAVEKVISIYSDPEHKLYSAFETSKINNSHSSASYFNYLKKIIRSLFQLPDFFETAFNQSSKLYDILETEPLVTNIARFGRSDNFNGYNCKSQNRIFDLSRARLLNSKKPKSFSIRALKNLLQLEFTDTESHINSRNQVQICTYYPPENKTVKKLRIDIIELLIEYFNNDANTEFKSECLYLLLNVPRGIYAVRNKAYKGKDEINLVLNFLLSIPAEKLELSEKQEIKNQLYFYEKWGLKDKKSLKIISEIKLNLSKKDITEQLFELFNPTYEDRIYEKQKYEDESKEILEIRSAKEIADSITKVVEQSEYLPHNLYPFLNQLSLNVVKSKEFIDYLWVTNNKFVVDHCSFILQELRFTHKEEEYYWKYVNLILNNKDSDSRNCILNIYRSLRISDFYNQSNEVLIQKDLDLIVKIFENSTIENYFHLAVSLPSLIFINKDIAISEIKKFLSICHERHMDNLFLGLNPFEDKFHNEIKELVLTSTIHLNLQYNIERILNKIIIKDGVQEVLDYFEKRLLYKRQRIKSEQTMLGYDFVPHHGSHSLLKDIDDETKEEIFRIALKWFVEFDFEPIETIYSTDLLNIFATNKFIDDATMQTYIEFLDIYSKEYLRVLNLIKSISVYEKKNDAIIEIIIRILNRSFESFDEEEFKKIQSNCYISLTNTGVKMGTPGEPFSVDVEMNDLLLKALDSKSLNSESRVFLTQVQKSVQSEIDSAKREEDGEEW